MAKRTNMHELQENEKDVTIKEFTERLNLKVLSRSKSSKMHIATYNISRPGLQLAGYYEHFSADRIQIFGEQEASYLLHKNEQERKIACDKLFEYDFPCMIYTASEEVPQQLLQSAKEKGKNLFYSKLRSTALMNEIGIYLNELLAPTETIHGGLVDMYGVGVLILGESSVGKSETALELIQRGHRLVADDAVTIKRISDRLVGTSPEKIRHLMEVRGVGIIDIRALYGAGAIRHTKVLDLVVMLEKWEDGKTYRRLGDEEGEYQILETQLPLYTVPVKPGRNVAVILEVLAKNHRLKLMGINALDELNNRLKSEIR